MPITHMQPDIPTSIPISWHCGSFDWTDQTNRCPCPVCKRLNKRERDGKTIYRVRQDETSANQAAGRAVWWANHQGFTKRAACRLAAEQKCPQAYGTDPNAEAMRQTRIHELWQELMRTLVPIER